MTDSGVFQQAVKGHLNSPSAQVLNTRTTAVRQILLKPAVYAGPGGICPKVATAANQSKTKRYEAGYVTNHV
jgi:hypothetical protein